ncbi:hypothetical protein LTR37_019009 [Vermiconidia calcicola]|uniref:Uncharacterized protein n=1 Tax=Vermiconidia calcicola TaxID=1690605 RepID=A0ACC3MF99_9PEZI|nr:hypothetical protein LTR37_019009 [Vermiconidia calcicola]
MAGVRDPQFWKRFSVAVHLDEENGQTQHELKHSDSWLARQQRKRSRRTCVCWIFWLCFLAIVAGIVIFIAWALKNGLFDGLGSANPNGGQMKARSLVLAISKGRLERPGAGVGAG